MTNWIRIGPSLIVIAVALHCCIPATASAQTYPIAKRIEMVGNRSFSKHQLLAKLNAHPQFLIASHAYGDSSKLADVIEQLLVKGYRNKGFDKVIVKCEEVASDDGASPSRWEIRINESKRILCGDVHILSAKQIDPQTLVHRLTQPYADSNTFPNFVRTNSIVVTHWVNEQGKESKLKEAVWKIGDEVRFDSELDLRKQVIQAIADLGFSQSDVLVRFDVDRTQQTATLIVEILDEGAMHRINEIRIQGNSINTNEQILNYLSMATGDIVNHNRLQQMTKRLWESGRFKKQQFRFDKPTQTLSLEVEECNELPPIDEPTNQTATVLMKASHWLSGVAARGDDIETFNDWGDSKLLVIESSDGLFVELKSSFDTSINDRSETMSLLIDRDMFVLNHSRLPECLRIRLSSMDGQIQFSKEHFADPEKDKFLKGTFTLSANTRRDKNEGPLKFNFRSSPVNWLPLAYRESVDRQFIGGELILTHEKESIHIDVESGKVNQWTTANGMLRFAPGLFHAARSTYIQELPEAIHRGDNSANAVTATIGYLISDPVVQTMNRERHEAMPMVERQAISAIRKLVNGGLLYGFDEALTWMDNDRREETFHIHMDAPEDLASEAIVWNLAARLTLQHVDKVFKEGTWPSIIIKESCLHVLEASKYGPKVMQDLVSDQRNGPLCMAAMTLAMKHFNSDSFRQVANIGLQRLTREAFCRDYDSLTAVVGDEFLVRLRSGVATLTEAEIESLANTLQHPGVGDVLRRIQQTSIKAGESESEFWYRVAHDPLAAWLRQNAS
ncbi:secreted protein [Rhodopirellula maiorica SM1]|uniref:Secreted protein n=1 Tax=Rhodopirellula maiorica SM1 TaxID=1265738 RepID=M5RTL7_9BACT|nr:POTRA domain-containing protein [Rhodopirellula maiorica]EMI22688.1 secreted protein [Rhodopirellula maiorica SM1]